jgi:hypothetical protein
LAAWSLKLGVLVKQKIEEPTQPVLRLHFNDEPTNAEKQSTAIFMASFFIRGEKKIFEIKNLT